MVPCILQGAFSISFYKVPVAGKSVSANTRRIIELVFDVKMNSCDHFGCHCHMLQKTCHYALFDISLRKSIMSMAAFDPPSHQGGGWKYLMQHLRAQVHPKGKSPSLSRYGPHWVTSPPPSHTLVLHWVMRPAAEVSIFGTLTCHVSKSFNFMEFEFHQFSNQWNLNQEVNKIFIMEYT